MKKLLFLLLLVLLASCAPEPHTTAACVSGDPAGFWLGLWHGIIAVITFIISLFTNDVVVYEINNNGGWYNFGFLIGIGTFTSGATKRRKKVVVKN